MHSASFEILHLILGVILKKVKVLFLFTSSCILVTRCLIGKRLAKIANNVDPDKTAPSV